MSSGGSNNSNSALKGAPTSTSTPTSNVHSNAGNGAANGGSGSNSVSLTPRFTNEEKEILYALFHQHEEVIDIKYRKKQKGKCSVRDAWQQIVDGFNGNPNVATLRNLKQIQKFWLNARLRKQYPFTPSSATSKSAAVRRTSTASSVSVVPTQQAVIAVPAPIKCEPEYAIASNDTPDTTHNADGDEYEEIELHASTVSDPLTVDSLDDSTENQQIQQQNHQHIQQQINHQQQSQQQQQQQHQQQQQQHQQTTLQAQHINVDQISAEKLTLNDLLHFKNVRPREEIILQIKHPDGGSITLPSPTRITIPHQQATFNQIIGEIKSQPQTQHIQVQQYQAQQIQQQQPQAQQVPQQQYNTAVNPTYCTYTTQHLPQVSTPSNVSQATNTSGATTSYMVAESFDDKINYFKLKEAELKCKEVQLQLEQKRIDLSRMQEELKHQKEIHRLQVEEMRIKIRILSEEEKRLRNKES